MVFYPSLLAYVHEWNKLNLCLGVRVCTTYYVGGSKAIAYRGAPATLPSSSVLMARRRTQLYAAVLLYTVYPIYRQKKIPVGVK